MKNKMNQIYYFWLVFILIFIPLYPKFPLFNVPGTYVAIRLEDFIVLLTFIFASLFWISYGSSIFQKSKSFILPFLLFWGIGAISVLNFIFIYQIGQPHLSFLHWLRRIEYTIPFFAFLILPLTKEKTKRLFQTIFLTTFLVDIYAFGQKYLNWPVVSTMNREFSKGKLLRLTWLARVNSTFAGHYDLAIFLVFVLNLALGFYFYYQLTSKFQKTLFWIWWIITLDVLILTASRVSLVAFLLTFPIILIKRKKWLLLTSLFLLTILLAFQSNNLNQRFYSLLPKPVQEKLATLKIKTHLTSEQFFAFHLNLHPHKKLLKVELNEVIPTPTPTPLPQLATKGNKIIKIKKIATSSAISTSSATLTPFPTPEPIAAAAERSSLIRFQVEWPRAIRAFLKNPLWGTGYSSLGLSTDNDYLRMLGETGIVGFLAFFLLWGNIILFLLPSKEKLSTITIAYLAAIASFFLSAFFIDAFESSKIAYYMWGITGILLSLTLHQKKKQK